MPRPKQKLTPPRLLIPSYASSHRKRDKREKKKWTLHLEVIITYINSRKYDQLRYIKKKN